MSEQKRIDKINQNLQLFKQDSVSFMNQQPIKTNDDGEVVVASNLFSDENVENKDYIAIRDGFRASFVNAEDEIEASTRAAFQANDLAQNLVDRYQYTDLVSMERDGLMTGALAESPWSDDYWALYSGTLGKRHADPLFPASDDWKVNHDYIQGNKAAGVLLIGDQQAIDRLSPSEKYDALVGDDDFTLTGKMWADGKGYYDQYGKVEKWMGVCHGWAPAAYMLDRPQKAIKVIAESGTTITFYPSDIKALATLLWANNMPRTRFIGGRCNEKEPAQDANGRITSQEGFDTNPGTWHLSVINQVGFSKRSLVLDATYDYEVWNQPMYKYSYTYFNPDSFTAANSLAEATVDIANFSNDRFPTYRSPKTKKVVGVHMEASYVVETDPNHDEFDSSAKDLIEKVDYYYDVELDINNKIIGGEWYMNKHPDFLWTPAPTGRAVTRFDHAITGQWAIDKKVPNHWLSHAKQASSADKAPLAAIVEQLIRFSRA